MDIFITPGIIMLHHVTYHRMIGVHVSEFCQLERKRSHVLADTYLSVTKYSFIR